MRSTPVRRHGAAVRTAVTIPVIALYLALGTVTWGPAWAAAPGVTSIKFEQSVLDNLGMRFSAAGTAPPQRREQTGFAAANPATLLFVAPGGDFEGFSGGELQHSGELILRIGERTLVLSDFVLRVAANPLELELFDAQGRRRFGFESPQPYIRDGVLHLQHVDVTIAPELAEELGRPELEGAYVGYAHVALPAPAASIAPRVHPAGETCSESLAGDRDVRLESLGTLSQLAREPGGRVSLTLDAVLRNVGEAAIEWYRSISPDGPATEIGEHPYLALHVYRLLDGRLQQIGRSDVKHAFFTTNTDCVPCPAGHVIYPGCVDVYAAATNANREFLGPREEVSAATGAWTSLGSHFDALPIDDFRHHADSAGEHDEFEHRLTVHETELQQGGEFFVEGWYIVRDDAEPFNNMGNYPIAPAFNGVWTFGPPTPIAHGSILDRVVDPGIPVQGARTVRLDTGEGWLQLSVVTTDLGGGQFHHEYALMNFDFDRRVGAFEVTLDAGVTVSNTEFVDADRDPDNDWTAMIGNPTVTWTAPAGNEQDWGTLHSFAFDTDAESPESNVRVTAAEAGMTAGYDLLAVPGSADDPLTDDDEDSQGGLAFGIPFAGLLLGVVLIQRRFRLRNHCENARR